MSLPVASLSGDGWYLVDKITGRVLENRFGRAEIATLYCFYGEAQRCVNLEL